MVMMATNKVQERIGKFIDKYYVTSDIPVEYEKRREFPRYPVADTIDIMIDSPDTPAEVILATGRDISMGGLGLYSHRPIPAGTEMVINIDNGRDRLLAKAVAVHSTMSVGLFKVGARFVV